MKIQEIELIAVAVKPEQYPEENKVEIAFAGRSNVGKSSLINMLVNRRNYARTSSTPGKTQTINFYEVDKTFRIVDLPGYGYAKTSKSVKENWGDMIETYLKNRTHLKKVVQLVDVRRPPTDLDIKMYEWLRYYGLDGVVVGTKADKISRNHIQKAKSDIRKSFNMTESDTIIFTSTLKKTGKESVLECLGTLIQE